MRTKDIILLAISIVFFSVFFPILLIVIRNNVNWFSIDDYTIAYTTQFLAYVISFLIFPKTFKYVATEINLVALKQVRTYIYMGVAFFITFVVHLLMNSDVINNEYSDWQPSVWIVLLLVILLPIFEEILFRGVLYKFLFIKKGKVAAIVLTTLIFAIMHNDNFLFYFCVGLFATVVRYKTSSIASSYILHVLWNLYAVFLI